MRIELSAVSARAPRPLIAYFVLAFVIAWGLALVAASRGQLYLLFVAMLAGPSIASLTLTAALDGRAGLHELARALTRVRVGRWYAALLVAPVVLALVLAALSSVSPVFRPSLVTGAPLGGVLAYAGIAGFGAGIFEELGWTGFATPRLLARHSWFRAGLLLGIPWAAWHVLPDYLARATHGPWWIAHMLEWFVALTAFRVLMTWVYRHTRSLALGMLMHASFTGSQALLWPGGTPLPEEVLWYGVFAVALWAALYAVTRPRDAFHRHGIAIYFALAFAISWGGILLVVGPTHILASPAVFESMRWVPVLLLGPTLASIALTGPRALGSMLSRWHVGLRWYAIALLAGPLCYLGAALIFSAWSRDVLPAILTADDRAGLAMRGLVVGLTAGVFEELGWTGFAVPALRRRHGVIATGLIVGVLWGAWHVVPELLGVREFDLVEYIPVYLLCVIASLTGFRILMTWVYDRTHSLPLAILMHAGLTCGMFVLQPAVMGRAIVELSIASTLSIWLAVAAIASLRHFRGARPQHPLGAPQ